MKKIILFLALLVIAVFEVFAANEFNIKSFIKSGDASCYINGQVITPVTTDKSTYYLDKITFITAIDNKTNSTTYLKGRWYDEDYAETKSVQNGKNAYFVSDEYMLKNQGGYNIYLSYAPPAVMAQIEANALKYTVSCPGYQHSCKYIKLEIEKCYSDPDFFYAYFHGVGALHYSKVNVYQDISYLLNSNGLSSDYLTPLPRSSVVEELENDSYILKIPRKDLRNKIDSIKIYVHGCIETLYTVASSKTCYFTNESTNKTIAQTNKEEKKSIPENKSAEKPVQKIPAPITNESLQSVKPEHIDFVYKIINFFKRMFGFLKR